MTTLALLNSNDLFVLGPFLAVALTGLLCLVPLGRLAPRFVSVVGMATAFVLALYGYAPATNKDEDFGERLGPALRDVVQFRMESVVATLLLVGFGFVIALWSATLPTRGARRERGSAAGLAMATAAALAMVLAKNAFLAFVAIEAFALACIVHALSHGDVERQRTVAATSLRSQLVTSLLLLQGLGLVYGSFGTLSILRIEAVNRPGLAVPEGLAVVGGTLVFVALFIRFGVTPFGRAKRRELVRLPRATRLVSIAIGSPALLLLLFAAAPRIPRYLLGVLPLLALAMLALGVVATWASRDRARLDASLATLSTGSLFLAFVSLTQGVGVQDAGYAIRAGLFALVPFALSWVLWIAGQEAAGLQGEELERMRGLGRRDPYAAVLMSLGAIGIVGLPLTSAFWGRWLLLQSSMSSIGTAWSLAYALASSLGAWWCLHFVGRLWFEAPSEAYSDASRDAHRETDAPSLANIAVTSFTALLLVLGFFLPSLLFDTLVHIAL